MKVRWCVSREKTVLKRKVYDKGQVHIVTVYTVQYIGTMLRIPLGRDKTFRQVLIYRARIFKRVWGPGIDSKE